jgi:hypothetical protein
MTFSILRRTSAAFLAAAAAAFISGGNASAQAPRPTSPAGAAPAAAPATNPGAAAAPGGGTATPGAPGTAEKPQDTLTVEALIGDAVSLSNQQYPEVESAIQRFRNSDPAGARDYLTMAKQKYPKVPPVDLLMAKMWVFFRNGEQARQKLEETVKNNPNDPEA